MAAIKSFRDLKVYQRALSEAKNIFLMLNRMIDRADDFCKSAS